VTTRVLYAHPDKWTIGAEFPPEERARMRAALAGFAAEWLAWKGTAKVAWGGAVVEDAEEQRQAAAAWRERAAEIGRRARRVHAGRGRGRGLDARPLVEAALDAVVTRALWESPRFEAGGSTLAFHPGWRIVLGLAGAADEAALPPLAKRWFLLVRAK